MPSKSSRAVRLGVVPLLAAAFLAGCGDEEEETAYCVDQNDEVVENRYCDDDDRGAYFWYFGGGSYIAGQRVKSGTKISTLDKAALAKRGGFGSASSSGGGVGKTFARSSGGSGGG